VNPAESDGFVHRFESGEAAGPVLLLLHGTGGDESDLLPLGPVLRPGAPLLSPRGRVLENGMPRFFRRFAEGVFDVEDLKARVLELADFVAAARVRYALAERPIVAVGFSNGANIASGLLLSKPHTLAGAALFRAMTPFEPEHPVALSGVPVFINDGHTDPMIPAADAERLAAILKAAGARVSLAWDGAGHALTPQGVTAARRWLDEEFPAG
jgi:predicted esterase